MLRRAGAVCTVAVLAVLVAAAWVHGGDGSHPSRPRAAAIIVDPRLPWVDEPSLELVVPTGAVSVRLNGPPREVAEAGVLSEADLDVVSPVTANIATVVSHEGDLVRGTWLFVLREGNEAQDLLDDILWLYLRVGYELVPTEHEGVVALEFEPEEGPVTYRAHYVSDRGVVRVEAFGPDGDAAAKALAELLSAQLRELPYAS